LVASLSMPSVPNTRLDSSESVGPGMLSITKPPSQKVITEEVESKSMSTASTIGGPPRKPFEKPILEEYSSGPPKSPRSPPYRQSSESGDATIEHQNRRLNLKPLNSAPDLKSTAFNLSIRSNQDIKKGSIMNSVIPEHAEVSTPRNTLQNSENPLKRLADRDKASSKRKFRDLFRPVSQKIFNKKDQRERRLPETTTLNTASPSTSFADDASLAESQSTDPDPITVHTSTPRPFPKKGIILHSCEDQSESMLNLEKSPTLMQSQRERIAESSGMIRWEERQGMKMSVGGRVHDNGNSVKNNGTKNTRQMAFDYYKLEKEKKRPLN